MFIVAGLVCTGLPLHLQAQAMIGKHPFSHTSPEFFQKQPSGNNFLQQTGEAEKINLFSSLSTRPEPLPNAEFNQYLPDSDKLLVQADGKIVVAGFFRTVNNIVHRRIVRLNADLSIDHSFQAAFNGNIQALAQQPDGKLLVSGTFNIVNGTKKIQLARLNPDGTLDESFDAGSGSDSVIFDIAVQSDGKILAAGNFTRFGSTGNFCVTRFNADGTPDPNFNSGLPLPIPNPNPPTFERSRALSIALQSDGKILLGGVFIIRYEGTTPIFSSLVRLNSNGSLDNDFNEHRIAWTVFKVVVQPDGKILIGGTLQPVSGVNHRAITRLNPDGSLDPNFNPNAAENSTVYSIFLRNDGKILISGSFSTFSNLPRKCLALLNADGSVDPSFVPQSNVTPIQYKTVVGISGNRVLAAQSFLRYLNGETDSLILFSAAGAEVSGFHFELTNPGTVLSTAAQPDGKFLVGGDFTGINGAPRISLARFNADGTLDPVFANINGVLDSGSLIKSIIPLSDGKILVGGRIFLKNVPGNFTVLRFYPDGKLDPVFASTAIPEIINGVHDMALQPDGKIVVVWGINSSDGMNGGIVRFNGDGTVDQGFPIVSNNLFLNSVALQPDGKIIVGGPWTYTTVNSQTGSVSYHGLLRYNPDGTFDAAYIPATVSEVETNRVTGVYGLKMQPDGKLMVGGNIYTDWSPQPSGIVRLNDNGTIDSSFNSGTIASIGGDQLVKDIELLPDGKLLIGGNFNRIGGVNRINVARLQADGSVDENFVADTDVYGMVNAVGLLSNGKYSIGGSFDTVSGEQRIALAVLNSRAVNKPAFDFDDDGRADVSVFRPNVGAWYLNQSSAGFSAVNFGNSTDKLVPADYDGDGKTDVAVFRDGNWYLLRSQAGFTAVSFGQSGDIPVPADFDGDGKAEVAVYRSGNWYILNLVNNQFSAVSFGNSSDMPLTGDFDGDDKADQAVFRPSEGYWYLNTSAQGIKAIGFGISTDKIVPADYDGDGKTDIAVYRDGNWYRLNSSNNQFVAVNFGLTSDLTVPADYDGDGKADVAVFRNGNWYILQSTNGFTAQSFGQTGDQPIPNTFVR